MRAILFFKLINLFYFKGSFKFYFLFVLSLIAGLFEYIGLILIYQFVLFLSNPNSIYCKKIITFFNENFDIVSFSKISLLLGIAVASVYIFKNLYMLFFVKFNNQVLQDLSVKITKKLVRIFLFQDFVKINNLSKEEKINILSKNEFVVWQYCYKFINLVANCAIVLIIISFLFIKFTLCALIAVFFISILAFVEYGYLKKHSTYQNKHFSSCFDDFNSILIKTVDLIKEIRLNNKQELFIDKIEKRALEYSILNNNRSFCSIFHIYFTEISIMIAFVVVLGALFYTTNFDNQLLITSISTICVIILRLAPLINRAQSCLYAINSNKAPVKELIRFASDFNIKDNIKSTKEIMPFENTIELQNVGFSYDENGECLQNINLKINQGEFIGIVGESGCFKTTLALIISGLIKPNEGKILVDGKTIKEDNLLKWQNNIAFLAQDYRILFNEHENLKNDYLEKMGLCIEKLDFEKLSCGQKQRFALANILSVNKKVLILDEATSACDVVSQEKISDILNGLKGEKTIISIAHRLQFIKNCDKVIFMEKGKIIDIDSFSNLNEKYEKFREIVNLSNFEIEKDES
mgnify:CR=1 FL=1